MTELVFTPSDFIAVFNQTLEFAYPNVIIEGELTNLRISKNRWLYFDLKDESAQLSFFGNVFQLPGPLEDGMMVRAIGTPRLHQRFGFSINLMSIMPVGEGSIKKAADLLRLKLEKEGLFDEARKRPLPDVSKTIGLVTAADSAACADFLKILNSHWGGVEVLLADCLVQGEQAPLQLVEAIERLNQLPQLPDVLVIIRGGGSAAFNDERLVRAVAASRIPTVVGIGHETDTSLAELAADKRASTPTNAAQIVVPNKRQVLADLASAKKILIRDIGLILESQREHLLSSGTGLKKALASMLNTYRDSVRSSKRLVTFFDPMAALKRGYSIVTKNNRYITSARQLAGGDHINLKFYDGQVAATAGRRLNDPA